MIFDSLKKLLSKVISLSDDENLIFYLSKSEALPSPLLVEEEMALMKSIYKIKEFIEIVGLFIRLMI